MFVDSPLEGGGFEPLVPRRRPSCESASNQDPEDFCAIPLIRRSETLHGGSPFGGDRDSTSDANLQAS